MPRTVYFCWPSQVAATSLRSTPQRHLCRRASYNRNGIICAPLLALFAPGCVKAASCCLSQWQRTACGADVPRAEVPMTLDTWAEKFESFERINSIRETNGNFDSCNSCLVLLFSAGNQPFTWVAWVKISVCFTYRIYPFETFEFFCSRIRGQWVHPCISAAHVSA